MDHPQFDRQTEHVNQIIEDMLRAYVVAKPTKWEGYPSIYRKDIVLLWLYMAFSHEPLIYVTMS